MNLSVDDCGIIKKIKLPKESKLRLDTLGVKVGQRLVVIAFSPFKSNVLIKINGFYLGLNKSIAKGIYIE